MSIDKYMVAKPADKIKLDDLDTAYTAGLKKEDTVSNAESNILKLRDLQQRLYASGRYSVLVIFQAMDAAGKDSTIAHVMSGVNPQGCRVWSFKQPSAEELRHDFLWRTYRVMPERGMIGIFNRSYYEEVLITRVHPEVVVGQGLPNVLSAEDVTEKLFEDRYTAINNMERHLTENGTVIIKFFLHISKEEQKKRFLRRIDTPEKNWKFSLADVRERQSWDAYQQAYEKCIRATSTDAAPWYIIPADHKWFMRNAVSEIIISRLEALGLEFPTVSDDFVDELLRAKEELLGEQ